MSERFKVSKAPESVESRGADDGDSAHGKLLLSKNGEFVIKLYEIR